MWAKFLYHYMITFLESGIEIFHNAAAMHLSQTHIVQQHTTLGYNVCCNPSVNQIYRSKLSDRDPNLLLSKAKVKTSSTCYGPIRPTQFTTRVRGVHCADSTPPHDTTSSLIALPPKLTHQ